MRRALQMFREGWKIYGLVQRGVRGRLQPKTGTLIVQNCCLPSKGKSGCPVGG